MEWGACVPGLRRRGGVQHSKVGELASNHRSAMETGDATGLEAGTSHVASVRRKFHGRFREMDSSHSFPSNHKKPTEDFAS